MANQEEKELRVTALENSAVILAAQQRTERELIETKEALRESEERLRATFEQAAVGIAITDFEGHFLEANPRCVELLKYSAEDLRQLTFLQLTHPQDVYETKIRLQELLAGKIKEYSLEKRYVRKDGSTFWSHTTATVLKDVNGTPYRLIGIIEDITARKIAEEALRKSEIFNRAIIDSSKDCTQIISLNGTLLWTSEPGRRALALLGLNNLLGKSWIDFWQGEEKTEAQAAVDAALQGSTGSFIGHIAGDGRSTWWDIVVTPILDLSGQPERLLAISRESTTRIQQEKAMRHQQAALEESEARYRSLAEERSRLLVMESRAREQVEEANRIKDQFLATLSHELRTPLNAILGWSQLAARKVDDPERIKESLCIIERNARSQSKIIEDLLDMNRIVSGTLKMESINVNLSRVVEEAIESVLPTAQAKEITFEKVFSEKNLCVLGDVNRLKQIVWNLLTNAIKFSKQHGKIKVDIHRSNANVEVAITDSGEGITPEFLPFVFDRFSQADTTSARRFGGLGLGLSIVRHLVKLHGGEINVFSEGPEKGTTFTVSFPIAVFKSEESNNSHASNGFLSSLSSDTFKGIRALVVDDEQDARAMIKTLLEEYGAKVESAGSSKEALDIISTSNFDLILSDIGMPNEDGYQFIRKVRKLPKDIAKKVPAIALTAYARSEDRIQALQAGFQMHLTKPVEPSELIAVINCIKSSK